MWAFLLIAASVLPGCSDYTLPSDVVTAPGGGAPTLQLSANRVRLDVGKMIVLSVKLLNTDRPNVPAVSWKTSDSTVAKVDSAGAVQAVGPGTATVTATVTSTAVERSSSTESTAPAGTTATGSTSATVTVSASTPADTTTTSPPLAGSPELPRATVDVSMPSGTGHSIHVSSGGDLQAAINGAAPGDEILLPAGATFTGNFTLPVKSGTGWIVIRTLGALPAPGTRVSPSDAPQMTKLVGSDPTFPVIQTALGAHNYRLIGLEITAKAGAAQAYSLVGLGDGSSAQNTVSKMAHHLVLDRDYVHGTSSLNFQRCIALNSGSTAIVDSYISECHGKDFDSQAIAGWNGSGPYLIQNNELDGAAENVMFGGATPAIVGLSPADITIKRNHFYKPLSWKGVWEVKNLFELKNAVRVLVDGNVFENNWADAQTGYALQLKSSAAISGAEWTVTSDVTFRNNIVRNSANGVDIAAMPDGPCQPARRILLENNLFTDIGGNMFLVLGHSGMVLDGVQIIHNTAVHGASANSFLYFDGGLLTHFAARDNIGTLGTYGILGSGSGIGVASLVQYAPSGYAVSGNLLLGNTNDATYPSGNSFAASVSAAHFVNPSSGNYAIASGPYSGFGADMAAITAATAGVVTNP
jgi:hypothetical protein